MKYWKLAQKELDLGCLVVEVCYENLGVNEIPAFHEPKSFHSFFCPTSIKPQKNIAWPISCHFLFISLFSYILQQIVSNNTKGEIFKRVFQENKAQQIFRKTNISYPSIRTRAYQGVRNVPFSENLVLCFLVTHVLD